MTRFNLVDYALTTLAKAINNFGLVIPGTGYGYTSPMTTITECVNSVTASLDCTTDSASDACVLAMSNCYPDVVHH